MGNEICLESLPNVLGSRLVTLSFHRIVACLLEICTAPSRRNRTSFRTIFEYWPAWQAFTPAPATKICHATTCIVLVPAWKILARATCKHCPSPRNFDRRWHIFSCFWLPVAAHPKIGTSCVAKSLEYCIFAIPSSVHGTHQSF